MIGNAGLVPAFLFVRLEWENGGMNTVLPLPILSPCVNICEMGDDGLCDGCLRTLDEIGGWMVMSPEMRRHVMETLIPARESTRG